MCRSCHVCSGDVSLLLTAVWRTSSAHCRRRKREGIDTRVAAGVSDIRRGVVDARGDPPDTFAVGGSRCCTATSTAWDLPDRRPRISKDRPGAPTTIPTSTFIPTTSLRFALLGWVEVKWPADWTLAPGCGACPRPAARRPDAGLPGGASGRPLNRCLPCTTWRTGDVLPGI